ncbi:MAG: hypothetical protein U0R24_10180 [Solirubrobacterales bacterium]
MGRTEKRRGSRTLEIRDWPFGSRGRRLFLGAVLLEAPPEDGWTKADLERAAGVERGGVDRLLDGAASLDLLRWDGRRWHRGEPPPRVAGPLEELVAVSRELPERSIEPLPRRAYTRHS